MAKKTSQEWLLQINAELKSAKVGVTVLQRGDRLCLRGTFPPKPESTRTEPHQQNIPLGIYANPAGFQRAKTEALNAGAALASKSFKWSDWGVADKDAPQPISFWLERFEEDYFLKRSRTPKSESTFEDYKSIWKTFRDVSLPLSEETIFDALFSTEPDTRKREKSCIYLKALAKLAGLEVELDAYKGSYSSEPINERDLPSDELIEFLYDSIPSRSWKWLFAMQATYGVRNHEALKYLDFSRFSEKILMVREGSKTGYREVWPYRPEWWEKWNLAEISTPNCSGKNNSDLSGRVCQAYKRYGIPFPPGNLRHSWAVRADFYRLSPILAAKMMGHSLEVHYKHYNRWLNRRHFQEAWEKSIAESVATEGKTKIKKLLTELQKEIVTAQILEEEAKSKALEQIQAIQALVL